jgi:hypothetical protein
MPDEAPSERLYRALVHLYPRPFTARFGDELVQLFGDQLRDARRRGRPFGVSATWLRTLGDLAVTALDEHLNGDRTVAHTLAPPSPLSRALGLGGIAAGIAVLMAFVVSEATFNTVPWLGTVRLFVFLLGAMAIVLGLRRRERRSAHWRRLDTFAASAAVLANAWYAGMLLLPIIGWAPFAGDNHIVGTLAGVALWLTDAALGLVIARHGGFLRVAGLTLALGSGLTLPGIDWFGLTRGDLSALFVPLALAGQGLNGIGWLLLGIDLATRRRPGGQGEADADPTAALGTAEGAGDAAGANPRQALWLALGSLVVLLGVGFAWGNRTAPPAAEAARRDLKAMIEDIPGATALRYGLTDDLGHSMDTVKVIAIPETGEFAGVYHTWRDDPGVFDVHLATSTDLVTWAWRVELGAEASQPTIKAASDGGYVVAWEVSPLIDSLGSQPKFLYYPSWDDLLAAKPSKTYDVGRSLSPCCEGTVNLYAASSRIVDAGFHYLRDMDVDRQARGTMDWSSWRASRQPQLDAAATSLGVTGNVGDRDTVTFRGVEFTLLEGQLRKDSYAWERVFLVDQANGVAERLELRTGDGSIAISNMTVEIVQLSGRPVLVVAAYVFSDGPQGGELLYYHVLDGA